jgi:hypothetical protein
MTWLRVSPALGLFLIACAPTYHTAPAYRFDPQAAHALEQRAAETCAAIDPPVPQPHRPFRTDGCSLFLDGWPTGDDWQGRCIDHDIAYWCGGPPALRARADEAFRQCLRDPTGSVMAFVMKVGVGAGGHPWMPAWYRWGYSHDYPAPYYGER